MGRRDQPLALFQPAVADWFRDSFASPTPPQSQGWPAIARGESTLILAPTGSGKTLTAFLWCINRIMFDPVPPKDRRCRVLYISPLKALAVDIERNLRAPIAGIANKAVARGDAFHQPAVAIRTGDTPAIERARFLREPADILITTPESLYLLLTSTARNALRSIDTVIVDEIHALVPTKRGAHLALSLERLEFLKHQEGATIQRIGLSATQRPLDEVARFLGGQRTRESARGQSEGPAGSAAKRRPQARARGGAARGVSNADSRAETARARTRITDPDEAIHDEFGSESVTPRYRPVTIVDTSEKKKLELRIEVPVEDMAKLGQPVEIPSGPAAQGPVRTSIFRTRLQAPVSAGLSPTSRANFAVFFCRERSFS